MKNKNKKIIIAFTIIFTIVFMAYWINFFVACAYRDYGNFIFNYLPNFSTFRFHQGYTPTDYEGSTWISESPEIKLNIINDEAKGYAIIDGKNLYIEADFTFYSLCTIYTGKEGEVHQVFQGDCKYFKDRCEIKVNLQDDKLFDGKYKKIVLYNNG